MSMKRTIGIAFLTGIIGLFSAKSQAQETEATPEDTPATAEIIEEAPQREYRSLLQEVYRSLMQTNLRLMKPRNPEVLAGVREMIAKQIPIQAAQRRQDYGLNAAQQNTTANLQLSQNLRIAEEQASIEVRARSDVYRRPEETALRIKTNGVNFSMRHNWRNRTGEIQTGVNRNNASLELRVRDYKDTTAKVSYGVNQHLRVRGGYDFASRIKSAGASLNCKRASLGIDRESGESYSWNQAGASFTLPGRSILDSIGLQHTRQSILGLEASSTKIVLEKKLSHPYAPFTTLNIAYGVSDNGSGRKREKAFSIEKKIGGHFTARAYVKKDLWENKAHPGISINYSRSF